MDNNIDSLKKLIERIKVIGFWGRLFRWKSMRQQLVGAATDLEKLIIQSDYLKEQNAKIENDLSSRNATISNLGERIKELDTTKQLLNQKYDNLQIERDNLKQQNIQLLAEEVGRKLKYENDVAALNSIKTKIETDREKEVDANYRKEIQRLENLKYTWKNHQENVKLNIKSICIKHTITYIDKVDFKGYPDNTLKISDELIVFDAKSPKGDDLSNFSPYLQKQAEEAKKYANIENVKRWIFFVVPSNTYEVLEKFVYNLADYDVFIVTLNSIEPIILSLKKIEDYDFAEQMSPEERENICRVLGKFAHLTKRRIQIDGFFAKKFIELAYKSETDLPKDILESVIEFEKADKLNPPQEKRVKAIPIADLEKENKKIQREAEGRGILMEDETIANMLVELPLYIKNKEK